MPAKKGNYFTQMAQKANQALVYARIDKLVNSEATHVKAYATVNLGGSFSVHGVRVVDGQKGLFVKMPQTSYKKHDGTMGYQDVFHPTTADARAELNARVLEAYQQKLAEDPTQAAASPGRNFNLLEDVDPDDPFADLGPEPPFDMGM